LRATPGRLPQPAEIVIGDYNLYGLTPL